MTTKDALQFAESDESTGGYVTKLALLALANEVRKLRESLRDSEDARKDADSYILALWRNNQLPSPMDERLRYRLTNR